MDYKPPRDQIQWAPPNQPFNLFFGGMAAPSVQSFYPRRSSRKGYQRRRSPPETGCGRVFSKGVLSGVSILASRLAISIYSVPSTWASSPFFTPGPSAGHPGKAVLSLSVHPKPGTVRFTVASLAPRVRPRALRRPNSAPHPTLACNRASVFTGRICSVLSARNAVCCALNACPANRCSGLLRGGSLGNGRCASTVRRLHARQQRQSPPCLASTRSRWRRGLVRWVRQQQPGRLAASSAARL